MKEEERRNIPSTRYSWLIWLVGVLGVVLIVSINKDTSSVLFAAMTLATLIIFPLTYKLGTKYGITNLDKEDSRYDAYVSEIGRTNGMMFLAMQAFITIMLLGLYLVNDPKFVNLILPFIIISFVAIFILILVQYAKIKKINKKYDIKACDLKLNEGYRWWGYNNPEDPRLFVPKRIAGMGTTVNFATKAGKMVYFGILVFVIAIIVLVFTMSGDYNVVLQNDDLKINANMYSATINYEDIENVELKSDDFKATRTNGFGGIKKSYGYFNVQGYGQLRLYMYQASDSYIVITLKDGEYIFLNEKTDSLTKELFENIKEEL